MKKLIFSLVVVCLSIISCRNNQQAKLIESYVSTIEGVVSDLKFKAIDIVESTPVTAVDSMIYSVYEQIPVKYTMVGDSFDVVLINNKEEQYNMVFKKTIIDDLLELDQKMIDLQRRRIIRSDSMINDLEINMRTRFNPYIDYATYISDFRDTKVEAQDEIEDRQKDIQKLELAKKYSLMPPETVLLSSFDCTYSIFNPLFQVKQTHRRRFYFDKELTKVVGSAVVNK